MPIQYTDGGTDNRTLTITGTEDVSILNGQTGITTTSENSTTIYTVANDTRIVIAAGATLNHDTERFRVIHNKQTRWLVDDPGIPGLQGPFNANVRNLSPIRLEGTYNYGVLKPAGNTDNIYTDGIGSVFNGNTGAEQWFNGGFTIGGGGAREYGNSLYIHTGGVLNINGGRVSGYFMFTNNGGTVNNTYNAKFLVLDETVANGGAGTEWTTRDYGGTYNTADFAIEGGSFSIGNGGNGRTYTADRSAAGVAYWNQQALVNFVPTTANTITTIRNASLSSNVVDFAPWGGRNTFATFNPGTRLQNIVQGTGINLNGGETTNTARNRGYSFWTRQLETNIRPLTNLATTAQGMFFCRDTNNAASTTAGSERSGRTPASRITQPTAFTDVNDYTYRGVYDGSISTFTVTGVGTAGDAVRAIGDNEVITAIHNLGAANRDDSKDRTTNADEGIWRKDLRTVSGMPGVDTMLFHFWSYEHNYVSQTPNLAGRDTHTFNLNLIADPAVTMTRAQVMAHTSTITVSSTGVITLTDNTNGDNIFDEAKYGKETDVTMQEVPTADTMAVTSEVITVGTDNIRVLSFGGRSPVLGSHTLSTGATHRGYIDIPALNLSNVNFTNLQVIGDAYVDNDNRGTVYTNFPAAVTATRLRGYYEETGTSDRLIAFPVGYDATGLRIERSDPTVTVTIRGNPTGLSRGPGVILEVVTIEPSTVTVDLESLTNGTAYAIQHNNVITNAGVKDNSTTDVVLSSATLTTITTMPVTLTTVTRNSQCAHKGIQAAANTSTTTILNHDLRADSPQIIQDVPEGTTTEIRLNVQSTLTDQNMETNLCHIQSLDSLATSPAAPENVTIAGANARQTENYARSMILQVLADSSLTIPTNGTSLLHDSFRATAFGLDFRQDRNYLEDISASLQIMDGARVTNDAQTFPITNRTRAQLRSPNTNKGTDGEPQVLFGPRTTAPTANQNAAATIREVREELDERLVTAENQTNAALGIPVQNEDETALSTTPTIPGSG